MMPFVRAEVDRTADTESDTSLGDVTQENSASAASAAMPLEDQAAAVFSSTSAQEPAARQPAQPRARPKSRGPLARVAPLNTVGDAHSPVMSPPDAPS